MSVFNPSAALSMVSACAALAERNTNKEALRGIAVQGRCERFAATDLETSLVSADFRWDQEWILVPAGKLLGALKALGDQEAEWIVGEVALTIRAPSARFTLPLLPKGDYPHPEPGKGADVIQPAATDLIEALEKVACCCATESARYTMTGIHLDKGKAIATDGRRLAVAEIAKEIPLREHPSAVIPSKILGTLKAVFGDRDKLTLAVVISPTAVDFIGGDVIVTTRQIEGRFPEYAAIMPKIIAHPVLAMSGAILEALRRVGFMVAKESSKIDLKFFPGTLTLATNNDEGGDASAQVDFDWKEKPLTMSVNPKFLTEILRGAGSGPITVGINGLSKPLVITAEGFQGLIMPMA